MKQVWAAKIQVPPNTQAPATQEALLKTQCATKTRTSVDGPRGLFFRLDQDQDE